MSRLITRLKLDTTLSVKFYWTNNYSQTARNDSTNKRQLKLHAQLTLKARDKKSQWPFIISQDALEILHQPKTSSWLANFLRSEVNNQITSSCHLSELWTSFWSYLDQILTWKSFFVVKSFDRLQFQSLKATKTSIEVK